MYGAVESCIVRRSQPEGDGVGLRHLLQIHTTSRKQVSHARLDLPEQRSGCARQRKRGQHRLVAPPMQHADRVFSLCPDHDVVRIFERISFLWSNALRGDVGQPAQTSRQRRNTAVVIRGQQVPQNPRCFAGAAIDRDPAHPHGHLPPVTVESPATCRVISRHADVESVAPVHFVHYVHDGAQMHTGAVQRKPRRPFVLAHRLMQQHQRLENGRLAGGIRAGQQRERRQRQPQQRETLEQPQIKQRQHRTPRSTQSSRRKNDMQPSWDRWVRR